ncbi:stage III sporulation protein AD [Laceyella sacchari]|uniref:Stage III sporulation protein AD n=2 Tax=Laceyella TaxID=292635 RepID=A0AA45WR92_9BACL|nr:MULTISPECIES: stage III sporulation protein AD [Laceyella]AUS08528.1 stage III sporulation protein AD [Laceyella sacchari]KPC77740.1 stage III sporulation protein AD [Thermoactinomyces vulgaris]MRG28199.1 stage III sporulation protein AD [Laceyella tengchongensis]PRZ13050.1 stage III sporulation protein AD [Laceyella sediminis]SMP28794.1 stage III sporulation protein AD [Laceyella tengchongensis]
MEIIQVVGLGLIATFLILIIKEQKPIFAFLLAAFVGVIIFISIAGKIAEVLGVLQSLAHQARVNDLFLETILKIIGIAYIAEFGAQVTRDAGQGAIASKIELAGKVLIMVMAIPIITVIIETVIRILPA